jgi:phosphatidate cytidylyltransferase
VTRVLSAIVLIPIVLGVIWFLPHVWVGAILFVVFLIAAYEAMGLVPGGRALGVALAILWILLPLMLLGSIHTHDGPGAVMILIGVIIASDSAQYYTGRAFGRHKLAPSISPSKTIEGAIGGVVVAPFVAVLLGHLWLPAVPPWQMSLVGMAMTIAGICGDLFESRLKRRAGVKDSGTLIPGHGGILDRIDSWLFATPVFWLFLRLMT